MLTTQLLNAPRPAGSIGVGLIDLDNFRLLNAVHGHASGDRALRMLGAELERELPSNAFLGRFGPDEFLVVAPGLSDQALVAVVERLRERLTKLAIRGTGGENLPLTVSAGICAFPEHGFAVTDLLSEVTVALGEAKASGGDQIRSASLTRPTPLRLGSFDVLQALVIAIDTKDRYTKHHSEDVARYATFLAGRLDVTEPLLASIRTAGLLHDVGKIGIPDEVLRKPGPLSAAEYDVVKQHVALGDLIIRDLPNVAVIRSGVRHHHERWDGTGYLTRLAGERIPLIARILAVADAFSAMTTTRPYRKAMSVREALDRLAEASGTQLDPTLVELFVTSIETRPDAPLPRTSHEPRQVRVA